MAVKVDAEKIESFPFHPIGCRKNIGGSGQMGMSSGHEGFDADAPIASEVVKVIDYPQIGCLIWVMDAG